jgi:hypothetical protein
MTINKDKYKRAFPTTIDNYYEGDETAGMELRDYFAAKALQGICASQPGLEWTNDFIAKEAYDIADAMMEARSK